MTFLWACLGISLAISVQPSAVHLEATGCPLVAIASVRLEVFDLAGRRVFASGPVPGATYKWYLQRDDGRPVANGVYLYVFFTQTADGTEVRSSVGKLAVRR
ncbi:MAG: hypothetical protein N3E42_04880 [Candidatus Bipolaricaulota bacterium]|nr:hypothetical protein [Candidatus Bipolaricaulota bacterium]